jgi:tetratricopeptide (TPR) repeat protein
MAKSKRPRSDAEASSPSAPIDWAEFEAAASEYIQSHLRRLTRLVRSNVVYGVHIHCDPPSGEIFPYLDVRPPDGGPDAIRFPGYPDHRPWKPDGLDYTLTGWEFLELEPDPRSPAVRRWHESSAAFYQTYIRRTSDEQGWRLSHEFLHHACLAALRLERETGFQFVPKREPCCILYVEDHDEAERDSWMRLIEARIEFAPLWKDGNDWPIQGRQPEIASATFACAAEYHRQSQVRQAAHLLRQAIACLSELQGPPAHRIQGTGIRLPIPENEAWARAYLGSAEMGYSYDQDREKLRAIRTALRFDPQLPDVYYALSQTRETSEAQVKDLDRAIALDASRPEFFASRGEKHLYADSEHWAQSVSDYTRAHELDPFNQRWLMRRAEGHEKLENYEAAIEDYSDVFELHHSVMSWYVRDALRGRAKCLQKVGRFRQALQEWNRLIAYEKYAEYFRNRALCHSKLGNTQRAENDKETARRLKKEER